MCNQLSSHIVKVYPALVVNALREIWFPVRRFPARRHRTPRKKLLCLYYSTTVCLYGSGKRNSTRAHSAIIRSLVSLSCFFFNYVPCRAECRLCGGGGLPPASTLLPLWLSSWVLWPLSLLVTEPTHRFPRHFYHYTRSNRGITPWLCDRLNVPIV